MVNDIEKNQYNDFSDIYRIDEENRNNNTRSRSLNNDRYCHPLSNQLVDYNSFITSNRTSFTFDNDVLSISSTGSNYNRIYQDITILIKSNPGKNISFSYSSLDDSQINDGSYNSLLYIVFSDSSYYYHRFSSGSYSIPNDTSNIVSAELRIFQNNTSSNHVGTVIINQPLLYFDNNSTYESYDGCLYGLELYNMIETNFISNNYYLNCGIIALFLALIILLINSPFLFIRKIKGD